MQSHSESKPKKTWAILIAAVFIIAMGLCINIIINTGSDFIKTSFAMALAALVSTYTIVQWNYKKALLSNQNFFTKAIKSEFEMSIIDNSPNAFAVTNENDVIVFSNPAFKELFFKSFPSFEGNTIHIIIAHQDPIEHQGDVMGIEDREHVTHTYQQKCSALRVHGSNYKAFEFQNVDEIVRLRSKLDDRFKVDELTSLYTRFHFNDLTDVILSKADSSEPHYLALIDINNFKILNDSAGHDVGDVILMELANIIRSHADDRDLIGRISGDEFSILFVNKSISEVERQLISLHKAINSYRIDHFDTQIGVSVSIGVTKASGGISFSGIRYLLQQADLAVMTAKKNSFIFKLYDDNDSDIVFYKEAPVWINRIKNAISHDTFELFVQEISPFDINKDLHLEVLLRMTDEKGGYYPPNKFFTVAEKFNLMKQIDEWVVVNSFKKIIDGTMHNCRVSINLSGDTIKDSSSIQRILYYANFYQIDASRVVFEITETMAIDNLNQAISNINTLRLAGFSIALDDFGSGFSTFKYIQSIPADYIKVDGIFVKNAVRNERDKAIVANIVSIAHELGMSCVAEFVEDEATLRLMKTLGIDYIQGYFVHKPLPAKQWQLELSDRQSKLSA